MSEIDVDPYVDLAVGTASADVVDWRGRSGLRRALRKALVRDVQSRVHDLDWARHYAERCPVHGAGPRDYQLREFDFGSAGRFLAGIHFRGLRQDAPFVGIAGRDRAFEDAHHVAKIVDRLAEAFSLFRPRWVSIYQWHGANEFALSLPGVAEGDQLLLAAPVTAVRSRPPPMHYDRVSVRSATTDEVWGAFERFYAAFHDRDRELRDRVPMSDRSLLEKCERSKSLFEVLIEGESAGVIGGFADRSYGLKGYLVADEILDDEHRGRGFAPAMQRRFIDALRASEDDLVFGTIAVQNAASIRTALRVGRVDVGGWWFVTIDQGA